MSVITVATLYLGLLLVFYSSAALVDQVSSLLRLRDHIQTHHTR